MNPETIPDHVFQFTECDRLPGSRGTEKPVQTDWAPTRWYAEVIWPDDVKWTYRTDSWHGLKDQEAADRLYERFAQTFPAVQRDPRVTVVLWGGEACRYEYGGQP
jgi:hypothetical protein